MKAQEAKLANDNLQVFVGINAYPWPRTDPGRVIIPPIHLCEAFPLLYFEYSFKASNQSAGFQRFLALSSNF